MVKSFFKRKTTVIIPCQDRVVAATRRGRNILRKEIPLAPDTIKPEPFSRNILSPAYDEAIKTLKNNGMSEGRITLVLPDGAYFLTFLELADLPADPIERKQMVLFYMKKRFQSKGEILVAEQPLSEGKILVAVASRENIDSYLKPFRNLRLKVSSVKPAVVSALNFFLSKYGYDFFIFVIFFEKRIVFLGIKDGYPVIYRALREPHTRYEFEEELSLVTKFLGGEPQTYGCGVAPYDFKGEIIDEDCIELIINGELL
ncbi:MAG: hypothetical protein J7L62_01980 [Candidatus Aminicenantes bacterium]|nr:hypothetical protein [Candidatus Aminicenantes bacterium]